MVVRSHALFFLGQPAAGLLMFALSQRWV